MKAIHITILGCGNVGGTLALMALEGQLKNIRLHKIVVVHRDKPRRAEIRDGSGKFQWHPLIVPENMLTTIGEPSVLEPSVDVVIDATASDTTELLIRAMAAGKHVVSANKKMVARDGARLMDMAATAGVNFLCEATVMAKIPVLMMARSVRHLEPRRIDAIVSGTCALICRRMRNEGTDFTTELVEAQKQGYAEADPSTDIDAHDAAAKVRILAHEYLAANSLVPTAGTMILREGIRGLPDFAHRFACATGRVVELVASAVIEDDQVGVMVIPTLVPKNSFLGGLQGVENGLVVEDQVGPSLESAGPGAGGLATSAAIIMDLHTIQVGRVQSGYAKETERSLLDPAQLRFRPVFVNASPEKATAVFSEKLRVLAEAGLSVEQIGNNPCATWMDHGQSVSYDAIACDTCDFATITRGRDLLRSLECVGDRPVYLLQTLGEAPLEYA